MYRNLYEQAQGRSTLQGPLLALSRAIWAAYERSVQLGMGKKRGLVGDD